MHIEFERRAGISGLLALGSTGEFPFFTVDERKAVLTTVAELAAPLPVFANVSDIRPRAATELSKAQIAELRAHLKDEEAAVRRTDVSGRTRLLADFHVVLARMLGNDVLAHILGELVSRSSLIALMYQSAHSAEHSFAEHVAIVDALEKRDARAAVRLMEEHLRHVERNLRLDPRVDDLEAVLAP